METRIRFKTVKVVTNLWRPEWGSWKGGDADLGADIVEKRPDIVFDF